MRTFVKSSEDHWAFLVFPNISLILSLILPFSGSFYEEDYDEDYDYDDNNYIDSTYGTKKEYASSSQKKVGWQKAALLAGDWFLVLMTF